LVFTLNGDAHLKKTKLYFAYGMNTNPEQMSYRCPTARALGLAKLHHHRFEFRTHATISASRGQVVEGVLWEITPDDEAALDRLEGYPVYYGKKTVMVEHQGQHFRAMVYVMDSTMLPAPPNNYYYQTVAEGYDKFGLSRQQLDLARRHAVLTYGKKFQDISALMENFS
jgi:gamma-glutamylcyclotransferase (GGCT)/AIG2-like uncharacterized protein YtfP